MHCETMKGLAVVREEDQSGLKSPQRPEPILNVSGTVVALCLVMLGLHFYLTMLNADDGRVRRNIGIDGRGIAFYFPTERTCFRRY